MHKGKGDTGMKNVYDGLLFFNGKWRDYQARVLDEAEGYLSDGKLHIVAAPGAGKTTLLRLLAGEISLDRDDKRAGAGIFTSKKLTVGILHQVPVLDGDKTVEELLLEACPAEDGFSRERFEYEMEYDRIFTGFGFEKKKKKVKYYILMIIH